MDSGQLAVGQQGITATAAKLWSSYRTTCIEPQSFICLPQIARIRMNMNECMISEVGLQPDDILVELKSFTKAGRKCYWALYLPRTIIFRGQ